MSLMPYQCNWCDTPLILQTEELDGCCSKDCLHKFYAWLGCLKEGLNQSLFSGSPAHNQFIKLDDSLDEVE